MNSTYSVGSLYECENIQTLIYGHEHDLVWRQTALGCYVLDILQDILQFNVTYAPRVSYTDDYDVPLANNSIDIYVQPMMFKREYLANAYPINFIFQWRFGFLLRFKRTELKAFFTLPFSTLVWTCIIWSLFLSATVFYLLSYWEKRLLGGERCLQREFLLAFSAYCQQILPLQANLSSRRIAYVIFILSAYVIHCFYTSTLLSHLVNDKGRGLNLEDLANTDYEFVIIKDMNLITEKQIQKVSRDKYLRIVEEKLYKSKVMDVYSALEAMRDTKTAVLTDYVTLYPVIKRLFDNQAQCELIEVNLYSKVKKYMFTSRTFPLAEQFKVVTLRLKEAGLLTRILQCDRLSISCNDIVNQEQAGMSCISTPLMLLAGSYALALLILIGEKIHFEFCHLWPYTE